MPLVSREILNCSNKCFMIDNHIAGQEPTFTITDTKLYVLVVTLSTQDNVKLLEQLKSGFERTINWNKYEPKVTVQEGNRYLDFVVTPSFQGVNRLFVLLFQYTNGRKSYTRYFLLLLVEKKEYNVLINGRNAFDQSMENNLVTYGNITAGQWHDYTIDCLLYYIYFTSYHKMIAIDLSKQQAIDADTKAISKSWLIWKHHNVFHYWRSKRNHLDLLKGTVKVL